MSIESPPRAFFVVWDVGGWNCDKNPTSRDAVVVLDETLAIVGRPWRCNLRRQINTAANTRDWVAALFTACAAPTPAEPCAAAFGQTNPTDAPTCALGGIALRQETRGIDRPCATRSPRVYWIWLPTDVLDTGQRTGAHR